VLERVPGDRLGWKPHPKSITIVRAYAFSHLFHHRGQLSVYLRLLDVSVPSIYGPSADENPVRTTAGV
jgi:uncharacterized damage-inducible protein DinB